jgi:hypothetical protein
MFITTISTSCKHFGVFNIRKTLLEMQDFYNTKMNTHKTQSINDRLIPRDFISFWFNVEQFYKEECKHNIAQNLSDYELQIYKNVAMYNSNLASQYAIAINRQVPELESVIAKSACASYLYAKLVLKDRFYEGEYVISQYSSYSHEYARDVIHGSFELGEPVIANDSYISLLYARDVLKNRFILGESNLCDNPYCKRVYERIFNIKLID